jgi:hypothetical protein
MTQRRWSFELDQRAETAALTAHGGVPLLIEAFRTSGAAVVVDANVVIKRRRRGLTPSELVEGLFSLWAAGGERCEDLAPLREDAALALRLGHGLPAPQTVRDFLGAFDEAAPPLWQGERCQVQGEGERLQGLAQAHRRLIGFLQERRPQAVATIDVSSRRRWRRCRPGSAPYACAATALCTSNPCCAGWRPRGSTTLRAGPRPPDGLRTGARLPDGLDPASRSGDRSRTGATFASPLHALDAAAR